MKKRIKHFLIFCCGWLCVTLGIIGAFLPVMPTTPFMILALGCFAETSPRFHAMLLNNRWIGGPLKQWDQTKTVRRRTKIQALIMLVIAFSFSITLLWGHIELQLLLLALAALMIGFVLKLKEAEPKYED
ncbi:YbaN family protein [Methylophaga pinxianii]|uniref:YbaN family protein n=1 Tax=Methylophaga pinxianii TaxID=2881052 RepID=UPI001CF55F60|nr:YbaN family protein [Methylophaga pinxianii]MCB2427301.1 YbaN family protein [Methylophaga pinxianii]UPH46432.1 YbaN family protein [Methylophaga pinxianii]